MEGDNCQAHFDLKCLTDLPTSNFCHCVYSTRNPEQKALEKSPGVRMAGATEEGVKNKCQTPSKATFLPVVCKHFLSPQPSCNHAPAFTRGVFTSNTITPAGETGEIKASGLCSLRPHYLFPPFTSFHQTPPIYEGVKAFNGILKTLKARRFV